jgi:hypothetical protein
MTEEGERSVWIVGNPDGGAQAIGHRYHLATCYVLDQIHNRDRVQKVKLAGLADAYLPCQICAPAGREPKGFQANGSQQTPEQQAARGLRPGDTAQVQFLDSGQLAHLRLIASEQRPGAGEVSIRSPLGAALLGKEAGAVVEFKTPNRSVRRVLLMHVNGENHAS